MKIHNILSKVYSSSAAIIVSTTILACLICHWTLAMTITAIVASIVISSPPAISLHLMFLLSQKIRMEKSFIWMIVFASIPVSSFIAALLLADFVPGKVWFLLLLGILSGYTGVLINGNTISQSFNSTDHERE